MERTEWTRVSPCWILIVLYSGIAVAYSDIDGWNTTYNASNYNASDLFADCRDPSLCGKPSGTAENVGFAFGLTIGAGLATTLGALLPLVPCVRKSNTKFLAAALGFAAGVMVYVSFTELWQVSRDNFCCHFPRHSELAATLAFFGGVLVTVLLNLLVWSIQKVECGCPSKSPCARRSHVRTELKANGFCTPSSNGNGPNLVTGDSTSNAALMPEEKDASDTLKNAHPNIESSVEQGLSNQLEQRGALVGSEALQIESNLPYQEEDIARGPAEFKELTDAVVHDQKHLARMGVLTGLAISIHNFPEGIATFVGTLSSLSLGAVLAIAIAIHNIPEGICVAMPVYYATGSKWKGVFWASLSGISEPVGALLAYIALKDVFSPLVYGICFGLISGMMVYIALKELLPTAYKFSGKPSQDVLVPIFLVVGMVVMAVSLLLLQV